MAVIRNTKVQLAVGVLLSALFLYLALRPVSLSDLAHALRSLNWFWAVPVIGITFLSMYLRAVRWRWLVRPEGEFTAWRLFGPMMAGFGINSIFPGRLGEFARAYILARGERLSVAAVFATIVVERIFDSVILLILLPIALASTKIDPSFSISYGEFTVTHADIEGLAHKLAIMCGVLSVGAVFMMWSPTRRLMQNIITRLPLIPSHIRGFLIRLLENFARGFASLRDARSWIVVTALTVAIWIAVGWSFQVMAFGFEGMRMTLMQGTAIMVITCFAILIPAAPGYWGLMQIGIVFGMYLLNVETSYARALTYALVLHSLQYFPIVAVGMFCLYREHVSLSEVTRAHPDGP